MNRAFGLIAGSKHEPTTLRGGDKIVHQKVGKIEFQRNGDVLYFVPDLLFSKIKDGDSVIYIGPAHPETVDAMVEVMAILHRLHVEKVEDSEARSIYRLYKNPTDATTV